MERAVDQFGQMQRGDMQILKISDFYRGDVDRAFHAAGGPPPTILFDPLDTALGLDSMRLFARICDQQAKRSGGAISRADLRLDDFGSMVDFMAVVERAPDNTASPFQTDWVFTFSGWETDFAHTDALTGQRASTALSAPVAAMVRDVWTHAAQDNGSRVLTCHTSPKDILQNDWSVLSVPLLSASGSGVDGFLLYARATNKLGIGLDVIPDPVLVVDGALRVRMVNEAARHVFETGRRSVGTTPPLSEYTNSDLDLSCKGPVYNMKSRRLRNICRCLLNGRVVSMQATLSPLKHNELDYIVILMQPV